MVAAPASSDMSPTAPNGIESFDLAIPPLSTLGAIRQKRQSQQVSPQGSIEVPRIWTGLWQLSSPAWGTAPAARIRREMKKHVEKGFTAFDMADHYGSAEQLFGNFRTSLPQDLSSPVIGATKWCIFKTPPSQSNPSNPYNDTLPREYVLEAVRERAKRMRIDFSRNKEEGNDSAMEARIDFLQFHWHDYSDKRYLQALHILASLRDPMNSNSTNGLNGAKSHRHKHTLSGLSERTLKGLAMNKHALHAMSMSSPSQPPIVPAAAECYPSPSSSYDSSPSSSYGGLPSPVKLMIPEQQLVPTEGEGGLMLDGVTGMQPTGTITPAVPNGTPAVINGAAEGGLNSGHVSMDGDEIRIGGIGLVNFDSTRVDEICASLGPGVILTNQVQFSLIDTRPIYKMAEVCKRHGIKLLTYGTLCGGFLSDKWLGVAEPNRYHEEPTLRDPLTPSQKKYLDIILSAWGTWPLFQQLLAVLRQIGDRHGGASIANVATRWVLDHDEFVGAVILGARLGVSDNTDDNRKVCGWRLTKEDHASIENILAKSNGKDLIRTIGDCGAEYR